MNEWRNFEEILSNQCIGVSTVLHFIKFEMEVLWNYDLSCKMNEGIFKGNKLKIQKHKNTSVSAHMHSDNIDEV